LVGVEGSGVASLVCALRLLQAEHSVLRSDRLGVPRDNEVQSSYGSLGWLRDGLDPGIKLARLPIPSDENASREAQRERQMRDNLRRASEAEQESVRWYRQHLDGAGIIHELPAAFVLTPTFEQVRQRVDGVLPPDLAFNHRVAYATQHGFSPTDLMRCLEDRLVGLLSTSTAAVDHTVATALQVGSPLPVYGLSTDELGRLLTFVETSVDLRDRSLVVIYGSDDFGDVYARRLDRSDHWEVLFANRAFWREPLANAFHRPVVRTCRKWLFPVARVQRTEGRVEVHLNYTSQAPYAARLVVDSLAPKSARQ